MHLSDDFLNNATAGNLMAISAVAFAYAARKVKSAFLEKIPVIKARLATFPDVGANNEANFQQRLTKYGKEKMWRMATVGALIFSLQMVNFPVDNGTSGHFLGGVLAAIILGPFESLLVMSAVLLIQAFLFGDGGILSLGANIFNMGIVGGLGGYYYFKFLTNGFKKLKSAFLKSSFVAAWFSVVFAAVAASFEIVISGTKNISIVLPAMTLTHITIGLGEGIITVVILLILKKNFKLEIFNNVNEK